MCGEIRDWEITVSFKAKLASTVYELNGVA